MSKEQILAEFDAKRDELREHLRVIAYAYDMKTMLDHVINYLKRGKDSVLFGYSLPILGEYEYGELHTRDNLVYLEPPGYHSDELCYVGLFMTQSKEVRQLMNDLQAERISVARGKTKSERLLSVGLVDQILTVVRQMIEQLQEVPLTQL